MSSGGTVLADRWQRHCRPTSSVVLGAVLATAHTRHLRFERAKVVLHWDGGGGLHWRCLCPVSVVEGGAVKAPGAGSGAAEDVAVLCVGSAHACS